jgi:hypothetical protein
MKYLISRQNFVREAKYSETKSDFLREKELGIALYEALILEDGWGSHGNTGGGSGPMANDIGWNDSLVGRLINHMIRKAKVAYKLKRIDSVIANLRFEMERIIDESELAKLDEEDQKLLVRVILSEFYAALKQAVEEGYKVETIKNITKDSIGRTEELKEDEVDEATKKKLLDELNKLLQFLEQFKGDEGDEDPSISEDEDEEEDEGKDEKDDGVLEPETSERLEQSFPTMVSNLNSLYGILITYKSVVQAAGSGGKNKGTAYKVQPGDTVKKVQANQAANKKKLDINAIRGKNPNLKGIGDDEELLKKNIKELVLESSMVFEDRAVSKEKVAQAEKSQKIAGGRTATVVGAGESHATQALSKINVAIKSLTSEDKGVAITADFVKALIDNVKNTENKNLIKSLYNEINVCLKGKRKATIQEPDPLYKESYEYLTHRTKDNKKGGMLPAVAEKIARFAKRAMQFDGENLYGSLGELGKHLQKFVETIKQNLKATIVEDKPAAPKKEGEKKEGEKKEDKPNESRIVGYSKFMMIREADEDDEDLAAGDPPSGTAAEKIKDFFDKNCMTVKEYVLEKTEYEKLKGNIEKIKKEKEGAIVLGGFDPVIEIMKLFNKAYKLYMEDFITKRSDFNPEQGRGTGTAMEYDKIGNAYRNKKIFNKWESAVYDILKDRKYQQIFSPKTKLRVGEEMREKAGANLRKFMTDLLDGDSLYGEGGGKEGKGAQAKLFDKYFGNPDDAAQTALNNNGAATKTEGEETGAAAAAAMEGALELSMVKKDNAEIRPRTFFTVRGKNKEGVVVNYSFFITSIDSEICYMHLSSSFTAFKRYMDGIDGPKKTLKDGQLKLNTSSVRDILFLRVDKKKDIKEKLMKPGKMTITCIDKNKAPRDIEITVSDAFWLCDEKTKEVYQVPESALQKLAENAKRIAGAGAKNILTPGLTKVER